MSIKDATRIVLREEAVLTTSYVVTPVNDANGALFDCSQFDAYNLYIDFTIGSLTSAEVKVEFSYDGTNWFQEPNSLVSGGTNTWTANVNIMTASCAIAPKMTMANKYMRVSCKGTGTVTGSKLAVAIELAKIY